MFSRTNLRKQLEKNKHNATSAFFLQDVQRVLSHNEGLRKEIKKELQNVTAGINSNQLVFDLLDTGKIFHLRHIEKLCIDYRLRFLDTAIFSQPIPEEAITEIYHLNKTHKTILQGFKIMAPAKAFRLKSYDDPMLFVPLGNQYYYLVHQWGTDMHFLRKCAVYPFRGLFSFTLVALFLSAVTTILLPLNILGENLQLASLIVFLFAFKSVFAVGLYAFYMSGKKLSNTCWDSPYL